MSVQKWAWGMGHGASGIGHPTILDFRLKIEELICNFNRKSKIGNLKSDD
jgi:hypothetical protein